VPEHVLAQEDFPRPALETTEIELISCKLHAAGFELADHLRGDEELTPGDASLEARDRWVGAVGQAYDQVLDAAEAVATTVDELALEQHREVENREIHTERLSEGAGERGGFSIPGVERRSRKRGRVGEQDRRTRARAG